MAVSKARWRRSGEPNGRCSHAASATHGRVLDDGAELGGERRAVHGVDGGDGGGRHARGSVRHDRRVPDVRAVLERCDVLARCSEEPGRLTRRFATPALAEARELVAGWMREAGLEPRRDAVGNLVGRRDGPGRTLLLGSHLDTVRDAGRYDGPLGVLLALAAAERVRDRPLPYALEVAAFADEEGVRYGTAYLGSAVPRRALRCRLARPPRRRRRDDGRRDPGLGRRSRRAGRAPAATTCSPTSRSTSSRARCSTTRRCRSRVVEAIAGQTRARATFTGTAAHAGTTPMDARRDALAAAAEWIGAVEAAGRGTAGLVATVGRARGRAGRGERRPGPGRRLARRAPRRRRGARGRRAGAARAGGWRPARRVASRPAGRTLQANARRAVRPGPDRPPGGRRGGGHRRRASRAWPAAPATTR